MEKVFDMLIAGVKAFFKMLIAGQNVLHKFLTGLVTDFPGFFAYFVEASIIIMFIMGFLLYKRKKQREVPVPPPSINVSPPPADPVMPDHTLRNVVIIIVLAFILVLLIFAAI